MGDDKHFQCLFSDWTLPDLAVSAIFSAWFHLVMKALKKGCELNIFEGAKKFSECKDKSVDLMETMSEPTWLKGKYDGMDIVGTLWHNVKFKQCLAGALGAALEAFDDWEKKFPLPKAPAEVMKAVPATNDFIESFWGTGV